MEGFVSDAQQLYRNFMAATPTLKHRLARTPKATDRLRGRSIAAV